MSNNIWTMIIKIAIILIFMRTSHVTPNRCVCVCVKKQANKSFVLLSYLSRYLDIHVHTIVNPQMKEIIDGKDF